MNGLHGSDAVALSWCVPEIRESLLFAAAELDRHLAGTPPAGNLERAAASLHRIGGALELANVAGVAVLTQAAESLIRRAVRQEIVIDGAAAATLKRAFSAVAEYLEDLLAGSAPPPVMLFAPYKALLQLAGAERIDPADLYFPELDIPPPPGMLSRTEHGGGDAALLSAQSARRDFERSLPGFLRGDDNAGALKTMHAAMVLMLGCQSGEQARAFFWMSTALVEALELGALPVDLYSKRLIARVNIQARRTLESREAVADRLLTDLLFALARATDLSPAAAEVRRHYRLAGTVPSDFERMGYGQADPALLLASKDGFRALRKSWEKTAAGVQGENGVFAAAARGLAAALRDQRFPGMAELADALAVVPPALESAPAPARAQDEALSLEVATAILFAEEALGAGARATPARDTTAGRLGARLLELIREPGNGGGPAPAWLLEVSLAASAGSTTAAMVLELKANLSGCEQALDLYFRDPSKAPGLAVAKPLLVQSAGVLRTLGHLEAARACAALEEDVASMGRGGGTASEGARRLVADNLSLLGFFVDSLLMPVSSDKIFRFDEAKREFRMHSAGEADVATAATPAETAPVQQAAADDSAAAEERELLEIFLMEAEEVLESIGQSLLQVRSAPSNRPAADNEGLTALRRAFHTLKGSSRMVGLMPFGEAAHAFEEVLNKRLSENMAADPALSDLVEAGRAHFARWVSRLREDPKTLLDSGALIARCEGLAGNDRSPAAKIAADVQPADEEPAEEEPAGKSKVAEKPATEKFVSEKLATEKFVTEEPVAEKPSAGSSLGEEPWARDPLSEKPHAEAPFAEASYTGKLSAELPAGETPPGEERIWIGARSIDPQLFSIFNEEAHDTRHRLHAALKGWQEGGGIAAPEPLVRALHSLVGTSRHVGLVHLRAIAEPAERFLVNHARTGLPLPAEHMELLQAAIGSIDSMLEQFSRRLEPLRDLPVERSIAELALQWADPEARPEPVATATSSGDHDRAPGPPDETDPVPVLVDDIDADLGPIFFEEADDLLPQIDRSLRQWREQPADEAAPRGLMRLLHTIKGSARMAGAMNFGEAIHDMESLVEEAIGLPEVPAALIDRLLARYDHAFAAYDQLKQPSQHHRAGAGLDGSAPGQLPSAVPVEILSAVQPGTAAPSPQGPAVSAQVIRVRADVLDRMVSESGEVSVARARLDSEMATIRQSLGELTENVNRLRAQLREIEIQADNQVQAKIAHSGDERADFDPLEFDRYTRFQELTKMLAESVNDVATVQQNAIRALDSASQDLVRQGHASRSLQQNLMRIRMVQFSTVSDRLYRVVRQAGKDSDKRVTMEFKGGNAEIDRSVLERMAAPMEHLLRNAVAHGIESRSRRIAAGKPEIGELVVDMRQEGSEVIMTFADDGAGLDYAAIEQRARQRGLLVAGKKVTERELGEMIFAPGFSTAAEVTTLAGRGVGLDVVRAEVSAMGGRIGIESTPGAGTRFLIHLPVSLAVSQVVLLSVGSATFAVQAALVERILQVKPDALAAAYQAHCIDSDGTDVPIYFLGSLLELPQSRPLPQRQSPVVVVRTGASLIGLHVDGVVPAQEVVIKNVGPQLARLAGIAGATVLGNGDIVLILNPAQLASAGLARGSGLGDSADFVPADLSEAATVMVVDDSVTVRKVTQRLLVREGYTVLLAKDGVDALRQLQDVVPDMMLVDIEMPRMDGFDLTRNIRASARLQNVPIIMITSRTADKHRNQAMSLGVDVFLGKPYPEEELLRHVKALVSPLRGIGSTAS